MKKIWLFLLFFIFIDVKAASVINPIEFDISDEFYLKVDKYYQDDVTYFNIVNNLGNNLTNDQLREILNRTTEDSQNYLSIYSKLKIKVTPLEDTMLEPLLTRYYLGFNEIWNYEEVELDVEKSLKATKMMLEDEIDLYSGGIIYKSPTDGSLTTIIPDDVDLAGLTLEEQLATLLNLDLSNNPDVVIDNYQNLYNIYGISGKNNIKRFDFYNSNDFSLIEKDVSNLDFLTSRYVVFKYDENVITTFNENDLVSENNDSKKIILLIIGILLLSFIITIMKLKKVFIFK